MYIRRPLCVFCLLFVLALAGVSAVTGTNSPPGYKELDGCSLEFKGTIKQIEQKDNNLILHIKDILKADGTDLNGNVLMYIPDDEQITQQLHIGAGIEAAGEFNDFNRAYNRGQFDLSGYRALRGYDYAVYKGRIHSVTRDHNRITDGLYRIKERTERVYEHYLNEKEYGVLEALVLADKGSLDRELKDMYSDAGIAHILALSGLHIAGIGLIIVNLLKKLRVPSWPAVLLASVLMLGYCLMIGMPVSAVRALIMFFISMGAVILKRSVDLRTSAALACLLMLIINPDRLYDASFLMSFSACLGIGLVYPYVRGLVLNLLGRSRVRILKRSEKRLVRFGMGILASLLLSACIQLAVIPFTMWFYYRIPVYGLIINLIVVPLTGVLLILAISVGFFGGIVMFALGYDSPVDKLVKLGSYLIHLILRVYELLTREASGMPGAVLVTGRPKIWQMIVYYMILSGIVAYAAYLEHKEKLFKRKIRKSPHVPLSEASGRLRDYLKERSRFVLIILVVSFMLLFVRINPAFEISSLYVGQGQCFVIHGRDVPTIMYDCGSTDEKQLCEYTIEPFLECLRLDHIDTVFISHMDTDHISGLLQLLSDDNSHISIDRIVISADPFQTQSKNYDSLMTLAHANGIPVYLMSAGDSMKWRDLSISCLWPAASGWKGADKVIEEHPADVWSDSADLNDGSLVLSVEYAKKGRRGSIVHSMTDDSDERPTALAIKDTADLRFLYNEKKEGAVSVMQGGKRNDDHCSVLLTGDISSEAEEKIVDNIRAQGLNTLGYDCLQVAHHGSAGSVSELFLSTVSPGLCIISAGIDNQYGHPHKETLELLNNNGIPTFVTAECGEIDIKPHRKGLVVVKNQEGIHGE